MAQVLASDFNNIRTKVANVLGTGSGQSGYGQTLQSTAGESTGNTIGADEWNDLRYDIINIGLHQTNAAPTLTSPTTGDTITFGATHPNTQFNTQIDSYVTSKFNIAAARTAITGKLNRTTTAAWSSLATCTATMTFANATDCRHFFNAGGKFRMSTSRSGGSSTSQNTAWTNLLSSVGNVEFGAATGGLKTVYQLTNANQLIYTITDSGAYSTNVFNLYARCNVANNSAGTATIIYIVWEWDDNHTNAFFDSVDGTLLADLDELKATGVMQPSGTFTITSPTYSISTITAS